MRFSIDSHFTWVSRAMVSHWQRWLGGCGVCCPDDGSAMRAGAPTWPLHCDPRFAFSILVCLWISMESQSSYDVWLCSCFSLIRTGSSLHVKYVDMERDKGDTYQDRLLFLGLGNILLVCRQGVISFWHVETCILSPYGGEGCVTHSHLCCDPMDFIGFIIV